MINILGDVEAAFKSLRPTRNFDRASTDLGSLYGQGFQRGFFGVQAIAKPVIISLSIFCVVLMLILLVLMVKPHKNSNEDQK